MDKCQRMTALTKALPFASFVARTSWRSGTREDSIWILLLSFFSPFHSYSARWQTVKRLPAGVSEQHIPAARFTEEHEEPQQRPDGCSGIHAVFTWQQVVSLFMSEGCSEQGRYSVQSQYCIVLHNPPTEALRSDSDGKGSLIISGQLDD